MEEELLKQEHGGGPVTELGLALATSRLNSRIRSQGLSSREVWTQRNQFTNEQIPLSDRSLILEQHRLLNINHPHSEQSKGVNRRPAPSPPLQVGDLVYLYSDRDKSRARDRYIVISLDGEWCFVKKFSGSQLRAASYKVKQAECYVVPSVTTEHSKKSHSHRRGGVLTAVHHPISLPRPHWTYFVPLSFYHLPPYSLRLRSRNSRKSQTFLLYTALERPQRSRKPPKYLEDYITD